MCIFFEPSILTCSNLSLENNWQSPLRWIEKTVYHIQEDSSSEHSTIIKKETNEMPSIPHWLIKIVYMYAVLRYIVN